MPRPNPPRPLGCEANVARRVADVRTQRGWTYEGLARRVTDAGCPIQASAIYKIEKGDPPRRISVDELVGFAAAFEIPVIELLETPEQVAERQVRQLFAQLENVFERMDPETAARIRKGLANAEWQRLPNGALIGNYVPPPAEQAEED